MTDKERKAEQQRRWYQKNKEKHIRNVRERNKRIIAENSERMMLYLSTHPCVDCGEDDPVVLEFDHVRGAKHRSISEMVTTTAHSWDAVLKEIEKCDVRVPIAIGEGPLHLGVGSEVRTRVNA